MARSDRGLTSTHAIFQIRRGLLKKYDSLSKFKIMSITTGIAMTLILAAIPWRFLSYGRPLFRLIFWEY